LLEKDKRLWEKNELSTILPYSKKEFKIPSNLFIIATMNTSDKSIVSLDTALRRRFWFIEVLPDYELLKLDNFLEIRKNESDKTKEEIKKLYNEIDLAELLVKINLRIEYLLDKDHIIGHSYFLQVESLDDLKQVFYNEIIPLLEEYFYWEEEKIKQVLGREFFKKDEKFNKNLFETEGDFEEEKEKIKDLENEEFIKALKNIIWSNNEKN